MLEAQIAEATHKGDAQEVDVPSSAVLEAYAHDLPLPMTSYLTSQRCQVSCGGYPFGDPHGMTSYLMSQQHEVTLLQDEGSGGCENIQVWSMSGHINLSQDVCL